MKTIHPLRTVILFSIAVLLSLLTIPRLSTDLSPHPPGNSFTISFGFDGNSPEDVDRQVTSAIENILTQLEDIQHISSYSSLDGGRVELSFSSGVDLNMKRFEISSLIRRLYPSLPPSTSYPIITYGSGPSTGNPLLTYTIHAQGQPTDIKRNTELLLTKDLSYTDGIQRIELSGVPATQATLRFDRKKCSALHITPQQVMASLEIFYRDAYTGSLHTADGQNFFLHIPAADASIDKIEQTILVTPTGFVQLKEVARLSLESPKSETYFRINGENAINLLVFAKKEENKIRLAQTIKDHISHLSNKLPPGYNLQLVYDDSDLLQQEIHKNESRAALSILILSLFILFVYRKWYYLITLLLGLLADLILTAGLAYLFKIDIHLYTIAGITLAFGIMIDNAIVTMDYYRQFHNYRVLRPMIAASITTVAALCLIFLLPEDIRAQLTDFAMIIILGLAASCSVALWLTPALYMLLIEGKELRRQSRFLQRKRQLHWRNRYFAVIRPLIPKRYLILTITLLLFSCSLWLFTRNAMKNAGFRSPEKNKLIINAALPIGNTPETMNDILSQIENTLTSIHGIQTFITNVYSGQNGNISISFQPAYENTAFPETLKEELVSHLANEEGVQWDVYGIGNGFNNKTQDELPDIRIIEKGYNYQELNRQVDFLVRHLNANPRIQKVNSDAWEDDANNQNREFVLELNSNKMALWHTSQQEIVEALQQTTQPAAQGGKIRIGRSWFPIMAKEASSDHYSIYDILNIPLSIDSNRSVRIKDIGSFEFRNTPLSIHRDNRQYIRMISCSYIGPPEVGDAYIKELLEKVRTQLPLGYSIKRQVLAAGWDESDQQYGLLIVLAIAIFFISSILFESLRQAAYILLLLPLSCIGLLAAFGTMRLYFDQGGYVAFIMLGSLVTGSAIYIINDSNLRRRKKDQGYNHRMTNAIFNRSRTFLLTVFSTCCGLVPFLAEGRHEAFWFDFSLGSMSGLLFSIPILLIILPLLLWNKKAQSAATFNSPTTVADAPAAALDTFTTRAASTPPPTAATPPEDPKRK